MACNERDALLYFIIGIGCISVESLDHCQFSLHIGSGNNGFRGIDTRR